MPLINDELRITVPKLHERSKSKPDHMFLFACILGSPIPYGTQKYSALLCLDKVFSTGIRYL